MTAQSLPDGNGAAGTKKGRETPARLHVSDGTASPDRTGDLQSHNLAL